MDFPGIAGSLKMTKVLQTARKLAALPRPIMIRGERGTGKELLARFIHHCSERGNENFIAMNCGNSHDELLNAELYGHEKGAFTGADKSRPGKIEQAENGTLFLDEIGNMSQRFQEMLLRVIEYGEYEKLGGSKLVKTNIRVISATNADLEYMMSRKLFRADLYDRLTFAELTIPPLRHRREEIPSLIIYFVKELQNEIPNLPAKKFLRETVELMMEYHWPGNIRQLKNAVERLYVYSDKVDITPDCLPHEIGGTAAAGKFAGGSFAAQVEKFKKELISAALERNSNNQRKAAEELEMSYDSLRHFYRKWFKDSD